MSLTTSFTARFRRMPIRQKLRLVIFLSSVLALGLAGLGIITADLLLSYEGLKRDLAAFVQIIGDNSTGALAFSDTRAAGEILAPLHARTHVETACLFQEDGTRLAVYVRAGFEGACPQPQENSLERTGTSLLLSQKIYRAGRFTGTLVLRYDLYELLDRAQLYGAMVLLALLLSSIIGLLLSSKLRALVAEPILELVNTARTVTQTRDYGIRAQKLSGDEIGVLSDALNQMLEAIQSRDENLRKALNAEKEAVRRLAQLNADLKRSNQDLESVAFVASHDLQEPLRMITSYSQLLVEEHSRGANGGSGFVKYIVDGTARMRALLADLLAYTQMSGSVEQESEIVDLNVVLKKVSETLSARIAETRAEITAGDLPTISAHEGRMTSVFLNLIGNALKYRSERPPQIHISVDDSGEMLEFAIADNGIGIEPQYREKVFVAFKRLHGRNIPGTGIGLAICQRIVERYGGQIRVDSILGKGSTFYFSLPKSMANRKAL